MKRTISFILLLLLCTTTSITPAWSTSPPYVPQVKIETLNEYHQYLQKTTFDYDFISYDQLSYLGDFDNFVHREVGDSKFAELGYGIKISDEERFSMEIYYSEQVNPKEFRAYVDVTPTTSDLRYQPEKTRYIHNENLIYLYFDIDDETHPDSILIAPFNPEWSAISHIYLRVGGKLFLLLITPSIYQAPTHPLYKFLSTETCDEAYAEFVYHITGEWPSLEDESNNTPPTDSNGAGVNNTTAATDTEQTLIEKLKSFDFGCQSVISGGAVTLLLCSGAAIAFIPKKKKRE